MLPGHDPAMISTITDGRIGMNSQALGLARAIACIGSNVIQQYTVTAPAWANLLPPSLAADWNLFSITPELQPRGDELIAIGCGEKAQPALLALKKRFGAFVVYIQRPRANEEKFDAIVAPRHDYSSKEIVHIEQTTASKVILTTGAVSPITPQVLNQQREPARKKFAAYAPPFIAVLIGGENRAYRPDQHQLVAQLSAIAEVTNATLLITTSRRSGDHIIHALQNHFADAHFVWCGDGDNPYADMVAAADAFCVTYDSINMISEACVTGRAVYLLPLRSKNGIRARRAARKFARFHADIINKGHARLWCGVTDTWTFFKSPPLNETVLAATAVWSLFSN